jgi:ABC-type Zn uptake system ZnuABC Zn-binding protein ZnuA
MRTVLAFAAVLLLAACGALTASPNASVEPSLKVVATTTVFADLVAQVGGERVSVHSLVPKGGEVHTFDPAPSDAAALSDAELLVMNGLGLDDWLEGFAREAGGGDIPVLVLGEDLDGVEYLEAGEGSVNPHVWMNPAYAALYVDRIESQLAQIDPEGAETYAANASAYRERLATLHKENCAQFEQVPAESRRVVSFHDAFPYFAAAYDIEIVGVVVDAPGQDPSAGQIAALIGEIRDAGVQVILSESQFSEDLLNTLAAETGAQVISDLYTDTLGDPPVDTYEGAIRHDVEQIIAAMT